MVHSDRLKPYFGENKPNWMDSDAVIYIKGEAIVNSASSGDNILLDELVIL